MALVTEIPAHEDQSQHLTTIEARWRTLLGRDEFVVLLTEDRGTAAGYLSAVRRLHLWSDRDILALDDLYVRASHREHGIGQALMAGMAGYAAPEQLTITWGVEPGNEAAQRFYRRRGATLRHKVIAGWALHAYTDAANTSG